MKHLQRKHLQRKHLQRKQHHEAATHRYQPAAQPPLSHQLPLRQGLAARSNDPP